MQKNTHVYIFTVVTAFHFRLVSEHLDCLLDTMVSFEGRI